MSNKRNIIILVVVLVALGGINLLQRASHHKRTSLPATKVLIKDEFKTDDLDRLTLGQGADPVDVDLVKGPDGWKVASSWDIKADQNRIDTLVKALSGLTGEFRSDKAAVVADYGLADSAAVHITGYKGTTPTFSLEVGNGSQGQPGNFVRMTGSNAVYLSTSNLLSPLGIYGDPAKPKNRQFMELQAVKEDRLAVDSIILDDGGHVLTLQKDFAMTEPDSSDTTGAGPKVNRSTWEWTLVGRHPQSLAKTKADGVLGSVVSIRATDVADPGAAPATYGLDKPSRTATLVMQDGTQVVLEFGNQREAEGDLPAGTFMRIQGDKTVWVVTDYTTKNIFKAEKDLLPDK